MKTILKRLVCSFIVMSMIIAMMPQNVMIAKATTTGMVYKYSTMVELDGSIYYIKTLEGDSNAYDIYRLDVSAGTNTKIASSDNYILNMVCYNDILYYTSSETDKTEYTIYSVSIDGGDIQTIGIGSIIYADKNGIFYTINDDKTCKLYKKTYEGSKDILIFTGNSAFTYIKNLGTSLYFGQYIESTSKIKLYSLESGKSKLTTLATSKIAQDSYFSNIPTISDVVNINGNIYYQYGTYEGTGSYWYGTLIKIDSDTKKKTTITKKMTDAVIFHNKTKIFYNDIEDAGKHYSYNTKTGKTTTYNCEIGYTESFNILGSKTYSAKAVSNKFITVSSFTSGTNKKNLIENFIKISYKQKSSLTYSAQVKQLGDYFLVPVECIDYSDLTYGWRGKYIGIKWYITDVDGTILGDFS